jgi:dipeptidyl aminopeptidase/acylaminoacyl peptidase
MKARLLVPLVALALSGLPLAAQPLEVARLLAPFPSELVGSPAGDAVAWIENDAGARNVWLARAPGWTAKRLTSFSGDDGSDLNSLAWSGDGKWLAFARGGDEAVPSSATTNPTSDPAGREQAVWTVDVDGQAPAKKIAAGGEPAPSPKGDRLAYVADGQLWLAGREAKAKPAQATKLPGTQSTPRWSPDGTRIAFVSGRDSHGFVGVLDPAAKRVVWLDPSVDTDVEPVWSPDGRSIAFVRLPAWDAPAAFLPRREAAEPWSIRVADAATGKGRELFRALPGPGSVFASVSSAPTLWWTADERIVFPWERGGWNHLWSAPAAGGAPVELTPGAFEVEHAALAGDRRTMLLSSNQSGLDERKVWRVAAAGGVASRLTQSAGVFEFLPAALADGAVALLESGARQPLRPVRVAGGAVTALHPEALARDFPAAELVEPENVVFPSTDGLAIHGQLFLPRGARAGENRPAVVFVHGGPIRQMLAGFHYMGYYTQAYAMNQALAARGFVVLSINYRSGIMYGLDFREAPGIGEAGASEFQDVLAGALYLKARPEVGSGKIGIWGGSYGGFLTAMALARASGLFAAGVDFHGVHDWNLEWPAASFTRDYVQTAERLARAYRASPLADISGWRSPVLLVHGDADHNVPFVETVRLAEALRKQGVPFEQLIFPDDVHDLLVRAHWLTAYAATLDFLERHLR